MQKAADLRQKSFMALRNYTEIKISLKERTREFKQRIDFRRKVIGLAQLRENSAIAIFDQSLENRVEIFNKYHCAKEFFRRAIEYKNIKNLERDKNNLASEQYKLRY